MYYARIVVSMSHIENKHNFTLEACSSVFTTLLSINLKSSFV